MKSSGKLKKPRYRLPSTPQGSIELLLTQNVPDLGQQGDLVKVKAGYARNYLLPHGLATTATDHNKRLVQRHQQRVQQLADAKLAELKQLAEMLQKRSMTIEANANEDGHLYGSVGAVEIAAAINKEGFALDAEHVRLEGPLKELGLYTIRVHLGQEVDADVKVWVVPSSGESRS
jgi:large subunit ribosomal protein L9